VDDFRVLRFGFVSDFDIRISDLAGMLGLGLHLAFPKVAARPNFLQDFSRGTAGSSV
jgi:hypothetical protein